MFQRLRQNVHDFKVEHKISEGFIRTSFAALSFLVASMGTMYYKVQLDESRKEVLEYQRFFTQNVAAARSHAFFKYAQKNKDQVGCDYEVVLGADIKRTRAIAIFCLEWLGAIGEESIRKKSEFRIQLYNVIAEQDKIFYQSLMKKKIPLEVVEKYERENPDLSKLLETLSENCNGTGVVMSFLDVKLSIYENTTDNHCTNPSK